METLSTILSNAKIEVHPEEIDEDDIHYSIDVPSQRGESNGF